MKKRIFTILLTCAMATTAIAPIQAGAAPKQTTQDTETAETQTDASEKTAANQSASKSGTTSGQKTSTQNQSSASDSEKETTETEEPDAPKVTVTFTIKKENLALKNAKKGKDITFGNKKIKLRATEEELNQLPDELTGTIDLSDSESGTHKYEVYLQDDLDQYVVDSSRKLKVTIKPKKTKITKLKAKNKKISIKWKQIPNVSGYRIYQKTGKGKYKKVKTINGNKASFTTGNKKKNVKYSFKVTTFDKTKDGIVESKRSAAKSIKIKYSYKDKKIKDSDSIMNGKTVRIYYDKNGKKVTDTDIIIGKQKKYYLYVNRTKNQVTAYAKSGKVFIPVKTFICSTGKATPTGTRKTLTKFRWKTLMGPVWGQWRTRITSDGVYFHSIFSDRAYDPKAMNVRAYNNLGTTCSHGCIRLQAYAAKWIYDNCKIGTTVKLYSKSGYEPFKRPVIGKLSSKHTWDPTDPTV